MAGKVMQAVQFDGYGGGAAALKHVELPVPTPTKGEVLLKLEATSLNPVDWKIQKGVLRPIMPRKFPYVPGKSIYPVPASLKISPVLHFPIALSLPFMNQV